MGRMNITTSCDIDVISRIDRHGISRSAALEFGAKFLLAQKGIGKFPENKLSDNLAKAQKRLHEKD